MSKKRKKDKKKKTEVKKAEPSRCIKCGEITNAFVCGMCLKCWNNPSDAPPGKERIPNE